MFLPPASAARPAAPAPSLPVLGPTATAGPPFHSNVSHPARWVDDTQDRLVPRWDAGTFSETGTEEQNDTAERHRRASLRPQYLLLSIQTPVGRSDVGRTLREYGRILWEIRLRHAPVRFLARTMRHDAVAALGGRDTPRGAEFVWRCKRISRMTIDLARIQHEALNHFPKAHARAVREEVGRHLAAALISLSAGQKYEGATRGRVFRIIECRIQRDQANWFTYPFLWLRSKLWC